MKALRVDEHLPLIVIEVVMVFGGALAFGWWQLSDIRRERRKREEAERRRRADTDAASQPQRPGSDHHAL